MALWVDLFRRHNLLTTASAISFQLLTAVAALGLLGLSLIGAFGLERQLWTERIAPGISPRFPPVMWDAIDLAVRRVFVHSTPLLISFAVGIAVWELSGAVRAVMGALNAIYGASEHRPMWQRFGLSFLLAALIGALVIAAALLALGGASVDEVPPLLTTIVRWLVAIGLLIVALAVLVRFAPAEHQPFAWVSAGSIATVAAWIVASLGFRVYITSVVSLRSPEGLLAGILVLTGYLYASSIVFLVGIELNRLLADETQAKRLGAIGRLRDAALLSSLDRRQRSS